MKSNNLLTIFLIGAAAGAATAILLAPRDGRKTLKKLQNKAARLSAELDRFTKNSHVKSGKVSQTAEDVEDAADTVSKVARGVKKVTS